MNNTNRIEPTYLFHASADDFKKIPGSPIAYWASRNVYNTFSNSVTISSFAVAKSGQNTGDNNRFVRFWSEVPLNTIGFGYETLEETKLKKHRWFPYNKGGNFRKWYGNFENLINWYNDGCEIKEYAVQRNNGKHWSRYIQNLDLMLKEGVTWTFISSSYFGARYTPKGHLFDYAGCSAFTSDDNLSVLVAVMCAKTGEHFLKYLNPTLNLQPGNVSNIPVPNLSEEDQKIIGDIVSRLIQISKSDWDAYETSWDFADNPLIRTQQPTLAQAFDNWQTQTQTAVAEMKRLEEENNKLFIDAYGLQDELTPDVPDEQITLTRADREKDSQRLMSYAIGCMMGRYSLDETGLIYANAGNIGFDVSRYTRFPADADGIVPITDTLWFEDDATQRIKEFLAVVWGEETLPANLAWLAHSLGKKGDESDEDTIRRYLSDKFYKDHLQTYKKRPIYWHFSSGKQGAFQALVYLHRYNESTLARMRAEYVVPLMGKLQSRIEMLTQDAQAATSTPARNKLNKQVENLNKKHLELLAFDEKLRHYADMRITLDLDDGVKVNYGKFGELLSDVKAITGGSDE